MSIKTYYIEKGKHSAKGLHFGLTFKNEIKFRACFDKSCLYDLESNDNYDINKLFGFSTTWFHHKQSARVGWRCLNGEKIQLVTYSYNKSQRSITESDILGEISPNEWFECEIIDIEHSYVFKLKIGFGDGKRIITAKDIKEKDWFLFHYLLFPYFGGNQPAPHDMKIFIEKI